MITKFLAKGLSACQICFCRFILGSIVLVPMIWGTSFQIKWMVVHFLRGALLAIAMRLYVYSLAHLAMSTVTAIAFTNPMFVLILARIFLKEQVKWPIWMATWVAFMGIAWIARPTVVVCSYIALASCIGATILFALLDIINKKYIVQESILAMVFFSNLMAACCISPIAWYYWQMPTIAQAKILALLGIGGNLILYCLLRAFSLVDAAVIAPFKYMELVVSILLGYCFFQEWPTWHTGLGALIIIFSTCFIAYYQRR